MIFLNISVVIKIFAKERNPKINVIIKIDLGLGFVNLLTNPSSFYLSKILVLTNGNNEVLFSRVIFFAQRPTLAVSNNSKSIRMF